MSTREPTPEASLTGRSIGPYTVGNRLGEGGAGVVYQATDTRIPRSVAIKALRVGRSADPQQRRRFLDEMRHLCRVEHSYVIRVYDTLEYEGELLLVMEHVRGRTLSQILEQGLPPRAEALRYATELCEALQALHQVHLVHRDLKPGNLMIAEDGHVRLMDFGLVSRAPALLTSTDTTLSGSSTTQTLNPVIGGTVPYMSPEQLQGHPVGPPSDLFSLGVVLCELFTGEYPFGHKTTPQVIAAIERDPPLVHAEELRRRFLADPIGKVVAQLLEKTPDRRPPSAGDVLSRLRSLDDRSRSRRRRLALAGGGLFLATVVGAWSLLPWTRDVLHPGAADAIARSPQAVKLIERAEGLAGEYRWSAALDLLDQALSLDADSVVALWRKANVLEAIGKRSDAVRTINEAVAKLEPAGVPAGSPYSLRVRGFQAVLTGDLATAVELYRAASNQPTADGQELRAYAGALAGRAQLDQALSVLTRAIELDPLDTEAFADRARIRVRLGDFASAFSDIEAAFATLSRLGVERGHGPLHEALAWIDYEDKRFEDALREYELAESAYRQDGLGLRAARPLKARGDMLLSMWRLDEAVAVLKSSIQMARESGAIDTEIHGWSSLGAALLRLRDLDSAADALRRSIDLAKTLGDWNQEASALGNLASVLILDRQVGPARESVTQMEELARDHSDADLQSQAALRAADLAQALGDHSRAEQLLASVLERTHLDPLTIDLRLSTLQRLAASSLDAGAPREALRWANDAVSAARFRGEPPRTGFTLTIRSRALARAGRSADARADLNEARSLLAPTKSPVLADALLLAEATIRYESGDWLGVVRSLEGATPRPTSEMSEALALELAALARLGRTREMQALCKQLSDVPWFPLERYQVPALCGPPPAR